MTRDVRPFSLAAGLAVCSRYVPDGDGRMKKLLVGLSLLAVAGVALAAQAGFCPFCLF